MWGRVHTACWAMALRCAAPPEDATLAGAVPLQDGDPNSHRGDVRATLHAFSVAIQRRARHAVIASDSQAAIDVCFDRAKHARDDHLAAAEVSALIDWLKVASHTGCSFNEAADGVAKTANLSTRPPMGWPKLQTSLMPGQTSPSAVKPFPTPSRRV